MGYRDHGSRNQGDEAALLKELIAFGLTRERALRFARGFIRKNPKNVEELVQQIEQLEHWQRAILASFEPHRTWCTECHAASHVWLTNTGFYCLACWRVHWDEHVAGAEANSERGFERPSAPLEMSST